MGLLVYLLSQERRRYKTDWQTDTDRQTDRQTDRCADREGINYVIKQWCPKFNLKIEEETDYITFYSDVDEDANLLEYNTLPSGVWIADMERLAEFIFRV